MELDGMLPVVEAGNYLAFWWSTRGISSQLLWEAYAEASSVSRKEMLAGRVLRLPIISWIYESLQRDNDQRVPEGYFVDKLQLQLHDKAQEQLDAAMSWGRFAELFAFDDHRGELYIERRA